MTALPSHALVKNFAAFKAQLGASGFHLCDAILLEDLPDDVWLEQPVLKGGSIILVAHAGPDFWQAFQRSGIQGNDPVDDFSAKETEKALVRYFPEVDRKLLFSTEDCQINLMALGRAFNLHSPSPLGMGIHKKYGLWSAYRAVWWVDAEQLTPRKPVINAPDICASCETQECIHCCPSQALTIGEAPDLMRCADYRLLPDSECQSTCVARMSCPYAKEYRYEASQMAYHYNLARSVIAAYRSNTAKPE